MELGGVKTAMVRIEGVSPLLMRSSRLVNPTDEISVAIKAITSKHHTKKTDADAIKLVELDFMAGLYENDNAGIHIPAVNVEGCIRSGARISSKGKTVESGVQVMPEFIPLIYDGPKTGKELYKDKRFVDSRAVGIGSNRIMRTRPRFDQWALEFELMIIEDIVSQSDIEDHLKKAGFLKGLGDFRPKFGRFVVQAFEWV